MAGKKLKTEDIIVRQDALQKLYEEYQSRNKHPSEAVIIKDMQEMGYETYNHSTLYRDQTMINRHSTFVRDIMESNFSSMVEREYSILDDIAEKLKIWEEKPPVITKMFFETNKNPDYDATNPNKKNADDNKIPEYIQVLKGMTQETLSPLTIADMRCKVAFTKLKLLDGDIVDTSLALLTQQFQSLNDQLEKSRIELEKIKVEKSEIKSRSSNK